jgi:CheY-like chemotaxis protein
MVEKKCAVLVVEDDLDIREAIQELLYEEGYSVRGAENGADALAQLQHGYRPDLILLDLMMPVMDGWAFCDESANDAAVAEIPIVVVSAVPDRKGPARAQAYLKKPIDFDNLLETVKRLCA